MKYNKGFGIGSIILLIAVVAVGAIVYHSTQSNNEETLIEDTMILSEEENESSEVVSNNYVPPAPPVTPPTTPTPPLAPPMEEENNQLPSCLVITSPTPNQVVSFPLTITGYINTGGSTTCEPWKSFEGEAGHVVVKDTNGNIQSNLKIINPTIDWYPGIQQLPITATIPSLLGTPYTSEINLHITGLAIADEDIPPTPIMIPLEVTPYP